MGTSTKIMEFLDDFNSAFGKTKFGKEEMTMDQCKEFMARKSSTWLSPLQPHASQRLSDGDGDRLTSCADEWLSFRGPGRHLPIPRYTSGRLAQSRATL